MKKIFGLHGLYNIGIQMKRTEPTKTFMMISNEKTFGLHGLCNIGIRMKRKEPAKTFIMISNEKNLWSPWFMQHRYSNETERAN